MNETAKSSEHIMMRTSQITPTIKNRFMSGFEMFIKKKSAVYGGYLIRNLTRGSRNGLPTYSKTPINKELRTAPKQ